MDMLDSYFAKSEGLDLLFCGSNPVFRINSPIEYCYTRNLSFQYSKKGSDSFECERKDSDDPADGEGIKDA